MLKPQVRISTMSYPMLRLAIDCFLEQWTEVAGDDIDHISVHTKECAELLSDLFAELAKRVPS
jgi:hypothetical protein